MLFFNSFSATDSYITKVTVMGIMLPVIVLGKFHDII